jgi:anti-sigma-K factor RskA
MTWTCDQIEARLSDYLEGLLQGLERAEFEAHTRTCKECAPLLESVRSLMTEMQSIEPLDVPPQLVRAILDQTLGPREKVSAWKALQNFIRGLATPRFAYGAASVMATFIILLNASGLSWKRPKLADIRPATVQRNIVRLGHQKYAQAVKYVSDLRVVYEIQSRLRQDENQLQVAPDDNSPKTNLEKQPGQTEDRTHAQPKQQNRANDLNHHMQILAVLFPMTWERSYR